MQWEEARIFVTSTCRQIYLETIPLLYTNTNLIFADPTDSTELFDQIGYNITCLLSRRCSDGGVLVLFFESGP